MFNFSEAVDYSQ